MLSFIRRKSCSMQIQSLTSKLFTSLSHLAPVTLPSRRETHFWYILPDEVKDQGLLSQYLQLLSPSEIENVFKMKGDNLQKRAILSRALVRTTLSRYTDSHTTPKSLMFRKNTFGKPEVNWQQDDNWDPPLLHFNISHTSSLVACGVTLDLPIGVDIEEKQRKLKNNLLSFTRRYFSSHEVEYLHAIPDPEIQRQEFIKLWTLKEAYVKAIGRGFSAAPFKSFTIRFRDAINPCLQVPQASTSEASHIVIEALDGSKHLTDSWKFALFEVASSHYAAICVGDTKWEDEDNTHKLKVWKTIPFVEDECISITDL